MLDVPIEEFEPEELQYLLGAILKIGPEFSKYLKACENGNFKMCRDLG